MDSNIRKFILDTRKKQMNTKGWKELGRTIKPTRRIHGQNYYLFDIGGPNDRMEMKRNVPKDRELKIVEVDGIEYIVYALYVGPKLEDVPKGRMNARAQKAIDKFINSSSMMSQAELGDLWGELGAALKFDNEKIRRASRIIRNRAKNPAMRKEAKEALSDMDFEGW